MVHDARARLIMNLKPSSMQPKGEVHVLEIGAKLFGKQTSPEQGGAAIEGAGSACAEDAGRLQVLGAQRLAMPALAGDAAHIVTIAGAVDAQRGQGRGLSHEPEA